MDIGDWIAVAAALIALAAMLVTLKQTREAVRARQASEDQAASGWRAANAAEFSAQADQAQLELARRTHHDGEAPKFLLRWVPDHLDDRGDRNWQRFEIKCVNAPRPLDRITVGIRSHRWVDLLRDEHGFTSPTLEFEDVAPGRVLRIDVHLAEQPQAQVILEIAAWRGTKNWLSYEYPYDTPDQHIWRDRPR